MQNKKRERFIRIAEARTDKIIKMIRLLSNCSNRAAYEYTDDEVRQIFGAIEKELKHAKLKFTQNERDRFKLRKTS